MSNGTTISGQDGIIKLGGTAELPMLTDWSFTAKSDLKTLDTRVMRSNGDGGSTNNGGYDKIVPGAKGATFDATIQWQESDAAGAMSQVRTTSVGSLVTFALYPNNSTSGKRVISGSAYISEVSPTATVDGVITQKVSFTVDGQWSDTVVA